ncbi:hypothetical protein CDZ96_13175 [Mameliella alba]|nr:hypothetical protein CDZ96_13175 [Mameliella alba]
MREGDVDQRHGALYRQPRYPALAARLGRRRDRQHRRLLRTPWRQAEHRLLRLQGRPITRCLAAEWGRYGVSAVNVAPGYIETDINTDYLSSPEGRAQVSARSVLKRPGRVDEIAALVGLVGTLVSGKVPFLTGETIFVDGSHGISL